MLNLNTLLNVKDIEAVNEYTRLRLRDPGWCKMSEAIALYEQRYLPEDKIRKLCEEAEGCTLHEPTLGFIPENVINDLRGDSLVPVTYYDMSRTVVCVYIPESKPQITSSKYNITLLPTTLHYYLKNYQYYYGRHPMLMEMPVAEIIKSIINEAIMLGAADITLSTVGETSRVYYNVRKKLVESRRCFEARQMDDIITYLCIKSPYDFKTRTPKYVDVDLTSEYRGRVVINAKYKGHTITIRLLPNSAFGENIDKLSLTDSTVEWLQENILDRQPGLRLIVGETMSGKNTTALALLSKLASENKYKIISVEMPVEQTLPGIEQINTETIEEYSQNIKSLIHQNPDFVYVAEIRDVTGLDTIQITNTGKCVLSTLHANSVADTLSRLVDITGLSLDRIVQTLHSVVYQKLLRDDERDVIYPRDRYCRFTDDLKYRLYGKSLGEMIQIIRDEEAGDSELIKLYSTK